MEYTYAIIFFIRCITTLWKAWYIHWQKQEELKRRRKKRKLFYERKITNTHLTFNRYIDWICKKNVWMKIKIYWHFFFISYKITLCLFWDVFLRQHCGNLPVYFLVKVHSQHSYVKNHLIFWKKRRIVSVE